MPDTPTQREWVLAALSAHERSLLRFAATLVGPDRARDVVQDTFLELCKADRAAIEGRLVPWLFTVARNRALSIRRVERRLLGEEEAHAMESPDDGPHGALETKEAGRAAAALVEGLPPKHREAVLLKFTGGLSYKEIAEVTGLTPGHVGVILHEAMTRIRQAMKRHESSPLVAGRRSA
ncbi:MAG TPA: sigma-70 family RNA polymerase sigma factor [Polyangiaceae bacterium]|nr:sigma-70 family RNA polymerase sigma factor [Polyangiaceae bacterium]